MRNNFKLSVFVFIFSLCMFLPNLKANQELPFFDPEKTISMDFQDARLKDILKIFSIQAGLNFIASEAVQDRNITLYLDNVPIKEAMDKIFRANNLSYELDKESSIFIVKDWGKPETETITRVFFLKHATVSSSSLIEEMSGLITEEAGLEGVGEGEGGGGGGGAAGSGKWTSEQESGLTKAVKKLLSDRGTVVEDYRTNSLVVTDIPSRMAIIAKTIAELDRPIPQVIIEVEMLDVSSNALEKLGIKFGDLTTMSSLFKATWTGATVDTGYPFGAWDKLYKVGADPHWGTLGLNTSSYSVLLDWIKEVADAKYLARPRIVTLDNEPAEIKVATNEVIGEKLTYNEAGGIAAREAERTITGILLRVTPQVNLETDDITMVLNPRVIEARTSEFGATYRDPEERGTKSSVRVKNGETIILGGLIRNQVYDTITKLPILSDIPVIGALFRHRSRTKGLDRELLIFITPRIVKDRNIELAETKKVTLPEREQSAALGVNRQLAISSSLNNFEKKKK